MKSIPISRKKSTLWHLFFSYSTVAYGVISGLLMVPLYLRFIPLELYGAWLATGNILSWVLVVDPGLSTVIMQRVGQNYGAGNLDSVGAYALGGLLLTALITIGVLIIGLLVAPHVATWVNLTDTDQAHDLQNNFIIGIVASGITLFAYSVGVVNLGLQRSFAHGAIFLTANLLTLAVTVVLLFAEFGLYSISLGLLTRALVFSLGEGGYMLWRLKREWIPLNFQPAVMRVMLGLLSFTSLGKVGGIISKNMDSFLVARFLGPDKVPIYVLSRRGMDVALTLLGRTGNALGPSLSHLSGELNFEKMRSILNRLLRMNLWVLGLAFGGFLAFNQDFVKIWVGSDFFVGPGISTIFCVSMVLTLIFTLLQTLCVALGDIKRNALVQFIQALVVFACLLGGTYYFGLLGTALAPIIGFLTVSLWYYPRSLTQHGGLESSDMGRHGLETAFSLGLGLILSFVFSKVSISTWLDLIIWAGVFSLVYVSILVIVRPLLRKEITALKHILISKFGRRKTLMNT